MQKILLDTNILLYATDTRSEFHEEAKSFINKNLEIKNKVFLTQGIIFEYYRVLTSPPVLKVISPEDAVKLFKFYLHNNNFQILFPTENTISIFENLLKPEMKSGKIYDILIASTMIENGIKTIYTKNTKDFKEIKEIEVIDPLK